MNAAPPPAPANALATLTPQERERVHVLAARLFGDALERNRNATTPEQIQRLSRRAWVAAFVFYHRSTADLVTSDLARAKPLRPRKPRKITA